MEFTIRLAGKMIALNSYYPLLETKCSAYRIDGGQPDFTAFLTMDDIRAEGNGCAEWRDSAEYLETLAALRKIAEYLPHCGRFLVHGAAITYGDDAYLFVAPSGTGKSTHIALWRKYLGDAVDIINGDKPVVSVEGETARIHGTPWGGKENWQKNRSAVLRGVCILQRSEENGIRLMDSSEGLEPLLRQVYLPSEESAAGLTLELLDRLLRLVPLYLLYCNPSEDAVRCSFEGMTGLDYRSAKLGG